MDAAAAYGRNPISTRFSLEMSKTRDGTAETVSRDQILRRKRGQGREILISPVQLMRYGEICV